MATPPVSARGVTVTFDRPQIIGIVNATPDSFSDGGRYSQTDAAVERALGLIKAGATVVDIGGESTRPGASPVDENTESERVVPIIRMLAKTQPGVCISVDTSKAAVAQRALEAGAHWVNDVTALSDSDMGTVIAAAGAALILMHMRGTPRTMQSEPIHYDDVVGEVVTFLQHAMDRAVEAGVERQRILLDPGIGFGKSTAHNVTLTAELSKLAELGRPVVYGPSRKRFLGDITGKEVKDRDRATAAACAIAASRGADAFRVHAVDACVDAIAVGQALRTA